MPRSGIVTDLAIEMIGAQDPKPQAGVMMITGFDRSTFGQALKDHGALIAADACPKSKSLSDPTTISSR